MARLFVALLLPDEIKNELIATQKAIKRLKQVEGNFVKAENLHLTLQFLGHVEEPRVVEIIDALATIIAPPMELSLQSVGKFPANSAHIHVIWASLKSSNTLLALVKQIKHQLTFIIPAEEHPFEAHLTLVRPRKVQRQAHFIDSLNHMRLNALRFTAHEFVLMESLLNHEGATYKILAKYPLEK